MLRAVGKSHVSLGPFGSGSVSNAAVEAGAAFGDATWRRRSHLAMERIPASGKKFSNAFTAFDPQATEQDAAARDRRLHHRSAQSD